jgi:hypothetical protein
MSQDLPIYDLQVDESTDGECEVSFVSMVDSPAIKENYFAFKNYRGLFADDEKRIVVGPAMIPDMLIYRNEPGMGEFYVKFSRETIETIAQKFFKKGYQKNVDLMHNGEKAPGVTIYQSFIQDSTKGLLGMGDKYPDGTWFVGAKVENDEVWAKIKDGTLKGWSVDGFFRAKRQKLSAQQIFEQIEKLLSQL